MKNVKVDKDTCIGCGFCFTNLEQVFTQGKDGLAETKITEIKDDLEEIEEIKDGCPVGAIEIYED